MFINELCPEIGSTIRPRFIAILLRSSTDILAVPNPYISITNSCRGHQYAFRIPGFSGFLSPADSRLSISFFKVYCVFENLFTTAQAKSGTRVLSESPDKSRDGASDLEVSNCSSYGLLRSRNLTICARLVYLLISKSKCLNGNSMESPFMNLWRPLRWDFQSLARKSFKSLALLNSLSLYQAPFHHQGHTEQGPLSRT